MSGEHSHAKSSSNMASVSVAGIPVAAVASSGTATATTNGGCLVGPSGLSLSSNKLVAYPSSFATATSSSASLSPHHSPSSSHQHHQQQQQHHQHSLGHSHHRYAKLNVGGRLFATSMDTLTKQDNMLKAMFSGRLELVTDQDGYTLIDRSGKHFELILNYLRDEDLNIVDVEAMGELELYELLKEAKFYCIQPLIALVEQRMSALKAAAAAAAQSNEPYIGSSVVSMVTSKSDLARILASTDKPCIRLLINRHNNKYSYTSTSDDNLLKNIELFERMATKFKARIHFIKDTASTEEICCWYFHGHGRKLAEVCCTSIVYTTEKKQTKVEFPDSRILEEIFVNAVLFESKETAPPASASSLDSINSLSLHQLPQHQQQQQMHQQQQQLQQAAQLHLNGILSIEDDSYSDEMQQQQQQQQQQQSIHHRMSLSGSASGMTLAINNATNQLPLVSVASSLSSSSSSSSSATAVNQSATNGATNSNNTSNNSNNGTSGTSSSNIGGSSGGKSSSKRNMR